MKKYLLLLLLTVAGYGQTYQNPTYGTITTKTAPISTTPPSMATVESSGVIGKIAPELIPITVTPTPTHFTPTSANLTGHFQGIDNALGNIVATTAGITTRVWFTADVSVVNAVNYYATNATGKGTAASAIQSVVNDDNQKKYFAQDLIGAPFASATVFPPGIYAGNLSASTSPNSAQQRYTVELYKTNNLGVPIASGVTGAPVGSLGVTVIVILDSGLLTLADGSVSNVQVSGNLGGTGFSIAVGERIRYHVSAEKVGTAAANITQSVYYGTSYNSFLDVPVTFKGSTIANDSGVSGATVTDALNTLNTRGLQPAYNNSVSPQITTSASLGAVTIKEGAGADTVTILEGKNLANTTTFSVNGAGGVTGSSLKATNLTDNTLPKSSSTGLVNSSITDSGTSGANRVDINNFISGNVVRVLPTGTTNIGQTVNITGTDATSVLNNTFLTVINEDGFSSPGLNVSGFGLTLNKSTNQSTANYNVLHVSANPAGTGTSNSITAIRANLTAGSAGTGAVTTVSYLDTRTTTHNNTYSITNFYGFNLPFTPVNNVTNAYGVRIGDLFGSTVSRAFDSNVTSGTGKFNIYAQGTANNYFKGKILVDAVDNGVDIARLNGTVLASGYKVTGTTGFLKSDGTVDTSVYALSSTTHNPVTLGTANGLSLSTQVLSLGLAGSGVTGALSGTDWNTFNNKQNALVNPITGTGTSGQVSFWNGTSTQTGDNGLFWDNANKRLGVGTTSPVSTLQIRTTSGNTDIKINSAVGDGLLDFELDGLGNFTQIYERTSGSFIFKQNLAERARFHSTGNLLIGTTTDNSQGLLQVNGNITASPATLSNQVVTKAQLDAGSTLYKKYRVGFNGTTSTAILQAGLYVMENNLGGNITWTRTAAGSLQGVLTGAFSSARVMVYQSLALSSTQAHINVYFADANTVIVEGWELGSKDDDATNGCRIGFDIYP